MHKNFYEPVNILKVYQSCSFVFPRPSRYIEIHDIAKTDNGYIEKAGRPLTAEVFRQLFELSIKSGDSGVKNLFEGKVIPENIISFNPSHAYKYICWYNKPQKRTIKIETNTESEFTCWMPGILYLVNNDELQIFSFKGSRKPKINTELFHVPLPNTINNYKFCWGSVNVKEKINNQRIDREIITWESLVWNTQFDRFNSNNYIDIIKKLDKTEKRYPVRSLKKTSLTLNNILP